MLHVVKPSKSMGYLHLIIVTEGLEVRNDVYHDSDIGSGDRMTDQEHAILKVLV